MNLVKLFSLRGSVVVSPPIIARRSPCRYGKFYSPMLKRWLLYVGSVLLGLAVVGGAAGRLRAGAALSHPALARSADRLPAQDSAADRLGRRRPAGRIRRGAPRGRHHRRCPGCDETGHLGRRRRALLSSTAASTISACCAPRWPTSTSGTQQGAGTITMQVARNFFLTREKTSPASSAKSCSPSRSRPICPRTRSSSSTSTRSFSASAPTASPPPSQIYFGKPLKDVTVAEAAMLAGLPKAPSAYNPVINPKRAKTRQLYVLRRMHELRLHQRCAVHGSTKRAARRPAGAARVEFRPMPSSSPRWRARPCSRHTARMPTPRASPSTRRFARPIRRPHTPRVRRGVLDYDQRHGYRGPEAYVSLPGRPRRTRGGARTGVPGDARQRRAVRRGRARRRDATEVKAVLADGEAVQVDRRRAQVRGPHRSATRPPPATASGAARSSASRRTTRDAGRIAQLPQVEAAFVSMRPERRRDPCRWSAASISTATSSTT